MPPRARKKDPEICGQCWPNGWPGSDVAATCEHGSWSRPEPKPGDEDDS